MDLEASARTAAADAISAQHLTTHNDRSDHDNGAGNRGGDSGGLGSHEVESGSGGNGNGDDEDPQRPKSREGAARTWRQFPMPSTGQYTDEARAALAKKLSAMHAHSMPPHHHQQQHNHSAENHKATTTTAPGARRSSSNYIQSRRGTPAVGAGSGAGSVTADVLRTRFGLPAAAPTGSKDANALHSASSSSGKKPVQSRRIISSQARSSNEGLLARSDGALSAAHAAAAAFAAKEWGGSSHNYSGNISSSSTADGSSGDNIWGGQFDQNSTSNGGSGSLSPLSQTNERATTRHSVTDPFASSLFLAAAEGGKNRHPHMNSVGGSTTSRSMNTGRFNNSSATSSSSSSGKLSGGRRGGGGGLAAGTSSAEKGRALLHGALVSPDNPFADPFADLDTPRLYSNSTRSSSGSDGMAHSASRPGRSQTKGGLGLSGAL